MTTIDKLDIGIHIQYARRTEFVERINAQYRLHEASSIPSQLQVVDLYPRMSELDILMGVIPRLAPWALFLPPDKFNLQRHSPFAFFRVAPMLGSLDKHDSDVAKLKRTKCKSKKKKKEKKTLLALFETVEEINDLIGFVIGRVGQFLQG
jgi:hypothetical protein